MWHGLGTGSKNPDINSHSSTEISILIVIAFGFFPANNNDLQILKMNWMVSEI
jgi:hypothetical protein